MPQKDLFSSIQPRSASQTDDDYREYVKSEIKRNNPDIRDFFLNDYANEYLSTQPTTQKVADNSLSELAKKYPKPKNTVEAFKDFVSPVAKPVLKDPLQEVAKVAKTEQQGLEAKLAEKKLQASDPMYANAPKIVAPQINPTQAVVDENKAMGDITNYLVNKSEQEKDVFTKTADLHVPKGSPAQKEAYAKTLRENQQSKVNYQAQLDANALPDEVFNQNVKVEDIKKENRGALVASKYGGDADNINNHLREYMESPQWKVDAMKYAKNPTDLDRASRIALDVYADKLAGTPSKVQEKVSNFMNSPIGQAIAPLAQTAEGLAKAPLETGGFLGAVLSKAAGLTDKSLAGKIAENQEKVDKTIPSFRSEAAPEWQQFVGEIGNSFGAIEGGVLGTGKVVPKLFEKGRKIAAYGDASELTKLASEAGKTVKSSYLSELTNALKSKSAIQSAEVLDNTLANIAMMGGAQVASEREKYKSWGFSDEEADKKALQSSLINSVGLALPNVIRPSAVSELKRLKGESGEVTALGRIKAAAKQGTHFATDMAALRAIQGGIDGQSLDQTFEGGAKAAAKDFILGAMMNAASGSHGRRSVSSTQREAIGNALKDRSTLNSELKGNEQEFATTNSFLNTIEPLYKSAKERGLNDNLAVADAIERASMIQSGRMLSEVENEIKASEGIYTAINEETGQPEQKVRYKHEDGQWHEEPSPALQERLQNLTNEYGFARQAADNIQKGIYDGNRVISSKQMAEIAAKKSPNSKLRPEQELPIEVNSPYNTEVIDLKQYADTPEVQKALESFGESELVNDAYTDVTPVIAEDGTILDGAKGIAAALSRGQTEMYGYKSLPESEVNEIANESANDSLPTEVSEKGLDKIGKTALKEMTEVYADVLNNNFTEDGLPDFASAMKAVIKDGLDRGYEKKDVLDMANRINANIPEPILERYYNDAIKIEQINESIPTNKSEGERIIESGETIEEVSPRPDIETDQTIVAEPIAESETVEITPENIDNGTTELGRTDGGSESKGEQGEEGTISAEQSVIEPNEGDVKTAKPDTNTPKIEQLGNYFIVSDKNGDPIDGTTFYSSKEAAEKVAQKLNDGQAKTNTQRESQKSDIVASKSSKKVTGQAKKRAAPTIKNEIYRRALEVESIDPTTKALQYFIGGGRISSASIKELYKNSKGEHNSKIGIIAKDAPSIDNLAHKLWEEGGEKDLSTSDYKNAIEDVLNSYSSRTAMAERVAEEHFDSQIEKYYSNLEAELKAEAKEYEEYISAVTDIFAEMTEAEVDKLLADESLSDEIVAKSLEPKTDSKSVLFELNSQLDQKQSELRKEENKLSKLQQGLQSAGKENQFDIFGSKPSDATLFETDLSEARKLVDAQKKIVEQKRDKLSEIKTKIDEVPSENQIALELSEPERVKLSDKLDKLADKLRGMEGEGNVYSTPIPPHIASDAVRLLAKLVRGGENMAEAIKKVIAYVNSKMDKPLKESEVKSFVENILGGEVPKEIYDQIKPEYKESDQFKVEATGEEVEKTIVSRLDKTKLDEKTNDALEASGLTRKRQRFDEVETAAKQFVDKVGYENAIKAIEEGKVYEGAEMNAVFTEIDKRIIDKILSMEEGAEKDALRTLRGELLDKYGEKGMTGGQFNAYSARVQADPSTPFNSQAEIKDWAKSNAGIISKEKEDEIIRKGEEIDRLNKRLRELEAEKTAQLAEQSLLDIKDDIQKKKLTSNKDAAKKIADKVRKLKSKPLKFTDADGNEITAMSNAAPFFNELIEIAAKSIEKTGEIADGIKAIRERLKQEGWFNKLSDRDKNAVYTQVESLLDKEITPDPTEGLTNQYIRDVVAKGVENFDDFIAKVQKDFPKMTKVEITDAISKYGKVINATRTELEKEVQKYKSMSLLASKLQRALNGERPVKTGFQRDAPDADIRSMMKELREAMKELPLDEGALENELKTSLDASKKRVQNRIEDLKKAIEERAKIVKVKKDPATDKRLDELKKDKEYWEGIYEETFAEPKLSEGENKIKSLETQLENIRSKKISDKDKPVFTEKETTEIENLKDEIARAKAEAGLTKSKQELKEPKVELSDGEKQILALQKRIDNLTSTSDKKEKFLTDQEKAEIESLKDDLLRKQQELGLVKSKQELPLDLAAKDEKEKNTRIESLHKRLDDLLINKGVKNESEKREVSAEEQDLLDQIAEQKELLGLKKSTGFESEQDKLDKFQAAIEKRIAEIKERKKANNLEADKKDNDIYKYTDAYKDAQKRFDAELAELKQLQEEAGIPEKKWIEKTKEALQKQIAEDQRRIDQKDFAKVERKKFDDTSEIIKLRAERLKIREELEKEKEKNRLENRTKWEKRKDALLSLWDIPRATRATGEASFVGVQGLIPTIKYGLTKPKQLADAIKKSFIHAFNEKKSQEWIDKMKSQDFYPLMKESKLALTEPNAKVTAAEETAFSNWTDTIWGIFDKSQKTNPFKAFERSAVTFLDSMRMNMFLDGVQTLEAEGYNPKENEKAFKDLAKYVNTFTGRGTLISGIEGTKAAEALTKVFFSPRLWAAKIQRLNPIYYKNLDPKVREMAIKDLTRFIGLSTSLTLLAAAQLNNDDNDKTSVELDPRSSDFMKLKYGNTRIDFFGGNLTELVYISRMMPYVGGYKSTKSNEVKELGADRFTPNRFDLTLTQATNKLNPAAAMVYRYFNKEKDGKGEWRDAYGKPYSLNQDVMESLTPIYWGNTVPELIQDKDADFALPALLGLGAFAFFGGGVNTYDPPKAKKKGNAARLTPQ